MSVNKRLNHLPASLRIDERDVVRVGKTRVTLETVLTAFKQGHSAEEIVHKYPALNVNEVKETIEYYLSNREEVDAYLEQIEKRSEALRQHLEARYPTDLLRERLRTQRVHRRG